MLLDQSQISVLLQCQVSRQGSVTWAVPASSLHNNVMPLTSPHLPHTCSDPRTQTHTPRSVAAGPTLALRILAGGTEVWLPSSPRLSSCLPICASSLSVSLNCGSQIEFTKQPNWLSIEKGFQREAGEGGDRQSTLQYRPNDLSLIRPRVKFV